MIATKFIPADGWHSCDHSHSEFNPCWQLRRESRQLNQTIYDETFGTNVRHETHVTDEADGAHESARTLVARRTRRTAQLSRRSERNALRIFWRSATPRGRYRRRQSPSL